MGFTVKSIDSNGVEEELINFTSLPKLLSWLRNTNEAYDSMLPNGIVVHFEQKLSNTNAKKIIKAIFDNCAEDCVKITQKIVKNKIFLCGKFK